MTRHFDYGLAAASGVLLACSFPSFGIPIIAWVALAPLLVALGGGTVGRAFFLGLTTGVVYFIGTLYWVSLVMHTYGGLAMWTAVLVNGLLIAYLALYPALFAAIMRHVIRRAGPAGLLATPLVWVATEFGRSYVITGFPWVLLGYSQVTVIPIAQLASALGVFGLSALIGFVTAAGVLAFGPARSRGSIGPVTQYTPAIVAFLLVLGIGIWGSQRVATGTLTRLGTPMTFGIVQGNVDQAEKWDPVRAGAIFDDYLRLTGDAIGRGAQVVVWPESSTPFLFEEDRPRAEQIRAIARAAGVSILLGSDQLERGQPPHYFNSAFLIRPDGATGGVYRKMHLVPFGEYVPLKTLLFFAAPLVEAVSDFSAGEAGVLLPLGPHPVSTAICYEVVYPDLVRASVVGGSQLLTTITNDAWFGRSSAPYQHFAQAAMRAIENGRYLVRSANTGISGIVDPYGRVQAQTDIFEPAVLVGQARLIQDLTLYARIGDGIAYASVAATGLLLLMARRRVQ